MSKIENPVVLIRKRDNDDSYAVAITSGSQNYRDAVLMASMEPDMVGDDVDTWSKTGYYMAAEIEQLREKLKRAEEKHLHLLGVVDDYDWQRQRLHAAAEKLSGGIDRKQRTGLVMLKMQKATPAFVNCVTPSHSVKVAVLPVQEQQKTAGATKKCRWCRSKAALPTPQRQPKSPVKQGWRYRKLWAANQWYMPAKKLSHTRRMASCCFASCLNPQETRQYRFIATLSQIRNTLKRSPARSFLNPASGLAKALALGWCSEHLRTALNVTQSLMPWVQRLAQSMMPL